MIYAVLALGDRKQGDSMNWKILRESMRLTKRRAPRSGVRYRPNLDALEDRTVLSPVTFTIVQDQSPLTLSGETVAGKRIKPQGAGALTTTYFGTFETDVDEANGTIRFIGTGNDFCAAETGNWAPLADGGSGTAPAIYGLKVRLLKTRLEAAIRDFHIKVDSTSLGLYQNDDGSFGFSSSQTITINAGTGTYAHPTLGHGPINFSGLNGPNQASDGSLVDNGHGTVRLTIPISVSMSGTIDGTMYTLNFVGQFVGTGSYPGPRAGDQSHNQAALGVALVSGARFMGTVSPAAAGMAARDPVDNRASSATITTETTSDATDSGVDGQTIHHAMAPAVGEFSALDSVFGELAPWMVLGAG
jgi:hypothetical protein